MLHTQRGCLNSRFISMFTTAGRWFISWARWLQSTPCHPISVSPLLILSSYLRLGLPSCLFLMLFNHKVCMHFCFLLHIQHFTISSPLSWSPLWYWAGSKIVKLFIRTMSTFSSNLIHWSIQHRCSLFGSDTEIIDVCNSALKASNSSTMCYAEQLQVFFLHS